MKGLSALGVVVAAIGLSPVALAQTRVMTAHDETATVMHCLLDHVRDGCRYDFVGNARGAGRYWLWWTADKDFQLGALASSEYAGSEAVNAYLTKFLNGKPADVYHVKFRHQEMTFYIVPPGSDGKVHYMRVRNGAPNDEREDLFVHGPG